MAPSVRGEARQLAQFVVGRFRQSLRSGIPFRVAADVLESDVARLIHYGITKGSILNRVQEVARG